MQDVKAWELADPGFFSATELLASGHRRHRVVEKLPDGGWDWSVWTAGGADDALYGREDTRSGALTAAERAAPTMFTCPS